MQKTMIVMLVASFVAGLSTSSFAQRTLLRQYQEPPVPSEAYNRCLQLALQRGITVSRGDDWIRDKFISDCLNGKIRN